MTIKKRLFFSNTVMMLISLSILFGTGAFTVFLFKDNFMNVLEQNAEIEENVEDVEETLSNIHSDKEDWKKLSHKLKKYDFELYVTDENGEVKYSNIKENESDYIEEFLDDEISDEMVESYSIDNIYIERCLVEIDGENYYVYAVYSSEESSFWGLECGTFEMFIIVFAINGIIAIIFLLILSQIFTKIQIKRIMKPVDELNFAAKRINEGNFNEEISYKSKDEFGEVCNTFNVMQKNLKEEMEKTASYEKARTEMISGISHDLRTPLTSVKAFIKGLLDGVAGTSEKQQQYLEISYKKACDMDILLQKLFFFSKMETGNMPFFKQKIEICSWMEKYVKEKQYEYENKNVKIFFNGGNREPYVYADIEQFKRVFDNLIENSVKYAEVEKLIILFDIYNSEFGNITIRVKDNGKGIPEEKIPHLFEQFYRGDESRSSKTEGSGLGLYVCKYIIEGHGGRISAENHDGLSVIIDLPSAKEDDHV